MEEAFEYFKQGGDYALIALVIYLHNDIKKMFIRKGAEANKLIGEKLDTLITLFGHRLDRIEKELDKVKKNGHT